MHTLYAQIPGATQPRRIKDLSDGDAVKLLSTFAARYSEHDPRLDEPSRLQFHVMPEQCVLQTESVLGTHLAGWHILEPNANLLAIDAVLSK